ncbi:hypothetical protein F5J12DRAFT_779973 [Pisolithus orientalis]|uniref:uncharacterized protein n=1 Tax=Pisolithus orientalis TaxID=936130 RepID=UPI0022259EFC|nr:uncharacterized protein F5J12DRAFT_779973 [Pisolithus orientalis]KAI6030965.1 hypothetical protein F5J12DRAFT_779973 [Pisolithus orientalis]
MKIPDGVEQICWGMKKISGMLEGKAVEIALDATYNTNAKHLELYSVLAEYDNAGFPLIQKPYNSGLLAFVTIIMFTHGLSMSTRIWQKLLCWWHLWRAVQEWLAREKLSKTPYHLLWANHEFSFISVDFQPLSTPDVAKFEGRVLLEHDEIPHDNIVPSLSNHIPNPSFSITTKPDISTYESITGTGRVISNTKLTIKVKAPKQLESTPS